MCGEKRVQFGLCLAKLDHPRVCGEKSWSLYGLSRKRGSPPRVRGEDYTVDDSYSLKGITPACAGRSQRALARAVRGLDHPRVCGEKSGALLSIQYSGGSPPRVRGEGPL